MSAGMICGYAALWNVVSQNLAERGDAPWYEKIEAGALVPAADLYVNSHHLAFSACAFRADSTLQVGIDGVGLWFEADLAATAHGFDIGNAMRRYGALAVSFTMSDEAARSEYVAGERVRVVERATVHSISIMRPGAACYSATRAWLKDADLVDPQARTLQQQFRVSRSQARASAGNADFFGKLRPMTWLEVKAAALRIGIAV